MELELKMNEFSPHDSSLDRVIEYHPPSPGPRPRKFILIYYKVVAPSTTVYIFISTSHVGRWGGEVDFPILKQKLFRRANYWILWRVLPMYIVIKKQSFIRLIYHIPKDSIRLKLIFIISALLQYLPSPQQLTKKNYPTRKITKIHN